MRGGRERNIMRWELRATLLRDQIARLDERLAHLDSPDGPNVPDAPAQRAQRDKLLAQRVQLARELDALGPDPHAKMG
ncbi:MAG TPA: hypothetical protein VF040_05405 [Ktedonobacterales bacterium]